MDGAKREPIVEVEGLSCRFGDYWVHRDLDLTAWRGEVLALIGDSGTGKTALLHQIIGLLRPTEGSVRVLGEPVHEITPTALRTLSRRWGILFQEGALFSALNVFENVAFPLYELRKDGHGLGDDDIRRLVYLRLDMVGLRPQDAEKYPAELSGGMTKRAALARAIVLDPELLFLDEPTTGLDPASSDEFDSLLIELRGELDFSVVMITHDRASLAALSDRVAVLDESRILAVGPLDEVAASNQDYIRRFFHRRRGDEVLRKLPTY